MKEQMSIENQRALAAYRYKNAFCSNRSFTQRIRKVFLSTF